MTSSLTFSGYAALLRDFIHAHSAPETAAGPQTRSNAGSVSPSPWGEGSLSRRSPAKAEGEGEPCPQLNGDSFNQLALSLFTLQFTHNPPYRRFCEARRVAPDTLEHWSRIPAMPAAAFKEFELTSLPAARRARVFHSSGTTTQRPGRHFHDAESLSLYEASLLPWFQTHLLPEFPSATPCRAVASGEGGRTPQSNSLRFLSLTPPPELAPHSSLVHMFATIHREFGSPDSAFTGLVQADGAWHVDLARSLLILREAIAAGLPIVVMGTAFNFVQLADYPESANRRLQLPAGSRVLETGGYKGRSRALTKPNLHALISQVLGIPPEGIVSEYGMCELSSQAYDQVIQPTSDVSTDSTPLLALGHPLPSSDEGRGQGEGSGERIFRFPPWARAQIVSPETGREVAEGETGMIRVFDLANLRSVLAVQTGDLGIRRGDGFELLGRVALSEPRGCSLMSA
jgi:hypothetical protein